MLAAVERGRLSRVLDEEAYGDNLRRWATEELRTFRVDGWPEPPVVDVTRVVSGMSASGGGTQIVMSKTASHRRTDGTWIDVVSHRPDDFEGLKEWIPLNMLTRASIR